MMLMDCLFLISLIETDRDWMMMNPHDDLRPLLPAWFPLLMDCIDWLISLLQCATKSKFSDYSTYRACNNRSMTWCDFFVPVPLPFKSYETTKYLSKHHTALHTHTYTTPQVHPQMMTTMTTLYSISVFLMCFLGFYVYSITSAYSSSSWESSRPRKLIEPPHDDHDFVNVPAVSLCIQVTFVVCRCFRWLPASLDFSCPCIRIPSSSSRW